MNYYLVLGMATAVYVVLGTAIWYRTRSLAFIAGLAFIYYWTLWGGWLIVYDLRGGESGMEYSYFYHKLFPVHLDSDYLTTLLLFSFFVVLIEVTVLLVAKPGDTQIPGRPIRICHKKMLFIATISGAVAYIIIRRSLGAAASLGVSAYQFVPVDPSISRFFSIHQILDRMCLFTTMIGLAVCFSGKKAKYIVGQQGLGYKVLYLAVLGGVFLMNLSIGNRRDLLANFLISVFFYLANAPKPKKLVLTLGSAAIMAAVGIVGLTRGVSVMGTLGNLGASGTALSAVTTLVKSNEPFAAHMSMYGVLHKNVPLTYGSSMVAFALSSIPRAVWVNRPPDIYTYYAGQVGAIEGQGYTIHHATGWYLNFGAAGIALGAVLLGWVWGSRWTKFQEFGEARTYWSRIFRVIAFWTFTGYISVLLRAGPEGYKTILVENFLVPTCIVGFAGSRLVLRLNRPRWVFGDKAVTAEQAGSQAAF